MFFYSICMHLLRYSSRTDLWSILLTETIYTEFCSSLIICLTRATPGKYTSYQIKKGRRIYVFFFFYYFYMYSFYYLNEFKNQG